MGMAQNCTMVRVIWPPGAALGQLRQAGRPIGEILKEELSRGASNLWWIPANLWHQMRQCARDSRICAGQLVKGSVLRSPRENMCQWHQWGEAAVGFRHPHACPVSTLEIQGPNAQLWEAYLKTEYPKRKCMHGHRQRSGDMYTWS